MSDKFSQSARRERIFYTGLAAVFATAVFAGFSRSYYLKGFFKAPTLSWVAHLHGFLFTLWILFFLGQTALVAIGRTNLHRRAGMVGAWVAGVLVVLGSIMTVVSVRSGYETGRPLMDTLFANAMVDLVLFCLLFGGGFYYRDKREIHKRLMALSMLPVILPAFARLPLSMSSVGCLIIAFSLAGVLYDLMFLRRVHVANVVGAALIVFTIPLRFTIAATPAWHSFVTWAIRY